MSFGFYHVYGGWWQVKGGSVYADDGIKSIVPSSLVTEKSLIIPDNTPAARVGLLSYGIDRPSDMLGTNPNAKVSSELWEIKSKYAGLKYDYAFYNTRFTSFTTTPWIPGESVPDLGTEYEIFTVKNGGAANFDFTLPPGSTRKVIFLINGDVTITSNISVPVGAYLGVISSGTITINPSVTNVDGWYVANNLSIPCAKDGLGLCNKTDVQLKANGSFVGWNGVTLSRDQERINNTQPSELFTYRPDLYLSSPQPMKIYNRFFKDFRP
jgi:hypothetical protein